MDTQAKENTFLSPESRALVHQARLEQVTNGCITVVCPKCQKHPKMTTTPRGERTIISCPCRYILDGEINL
jgi:hypothetical protein